jgi:two-component system, OmpR family, sensor kinase
VSDNAHEEGPNGARLRAPRLRTGLLAALAYIVLLAIVALGVPLALSLGSRVNAEVHSQAQGQADLVAATAADLLGSTRRRALQALTVSAALQVHGRVLVVDRDGTVLADSAGPGQLGSSYAARPEIASALTGHPVQVQRSSRTLGQEILATAVPIIRGRAPEGAVRVTQSVAAVHSAIRRVELGLGLIGLVVLALGLAAGAVIAAQIARPLGRLERVAQRVAAGDLSARAPLEGSREQRSLAASFNEMTTRIARLLAAQRAFVADASHQLRTPLTGLRLRLEEARAAGLTPAAAAELDAGAREVDRLAQIVDELLVLSRAGERELPGEAVDLHHLASGAIERWHAGALEQGLTLEHETRPAQALPAVAWCASADAERALDALIENALRYSPSHSTVTIVSAPGRIEVRDRGPGIAADEQEAIFERFHRGQAGRQVPAGSGLGLNIARELAREWGGDVTLANCDGGGAMAVLYLPKPAECLKGKR